jgi:cytochrome c553
LLSVHFPRAARVSLALALSALAVGCNAEAAHTHTGPELFADNCAPCHGPDAGGNDNAKAPTIAGLPEWYVKHQVDGFRAGYRGQHYDDVQGMRMRPMALTLHNQGEVDAVAKAVAAMPRKPATPTLKGGDAEKGKAAFGVCTACHGADGKGNESLGAPPLVGATDWYLMRQLQNFKAGIRGAKDGDTRGATMRPMAATLTDDQAIKDVLAYVATLPK